MKVVKYILGILVLLAVAFITLGLLNPELNYQSRTEVNASVEQTFAVFNNPDRMGEWLPGFKSIENISGGANEVGSKWRLVFEENGEVMEVTEEVTAFEENELFSFILDGDVVTGNVEIRFVPMDSTKTEITAKTTSKGKNMIWRSILAMAESSMQQRDQDSYTRLKEIIEKEL